jgi:predicted ester cyclase
MPAGTLWGRDIADLLAPAGAPAPGFSGFDPEYSDIVDYILRCTHRIWEQKDIGLIETHYSPDCMIHTPSGPIVGADTVVAGTLKTLAGFPDRTLIGEAVIWSEEGPGAFLSSHRISSTATNLGVSEFGAATGAPVAFTTIADCLCVANRIVEEWLVRDNSAIALQLGFSPRAIARAQAEHDRAAAAGPAPWRSAALERVRGTARTRFPQSAAPPDPRTDPHAFAEFYVDAVFNHRRLGLARDLYAPNARQRLPSGRRGFGHGEIIGWLAALLATFPDARMRAQHVATVREGSAVDIALRWEIAGAHTGAALYGPPSGRDVWILGISHWRTFDGRIAEDVTLIDEIALLRQIEGGL